MPESMFNEANLNYGSCSDGDYAVFKELGIIEAHLRNITAVTCICCGEKKLPYTYRHGYPVCRDCAFSNKLKPFKCATCGNVVGFDDSDVKSGAVICKNCLNAVKSAKKERENYARIHDWHTFNELFPPGTDAHKRLCRNRIGSIPELLKIGSSEFLKMKDIGPATYQKVCDALKKLGIDKW